MATESRSVSRIAPRTGVLNFRVSRSVRVAGWCTLVLVKVGAPKYSSIITDDDVLLGSNIINLNRFDSGSEPVTN